MKSTLIPALLLSLACLSPLAAAPAQAVQPGTRPPEHGCVTRTSGTPSATGLTLRITTTCSYVTRAYVTCYYSGTPSGAAKSFGYYQTGHGGTVGSSGSSSAICPGRGVREITSWGWQAYSGGAWQTVPLG